MLARACAAVAAVLAGLAQLAGWALRRAASIQPPPLTRATRNLAAGAAFVALAVPVTAAAAITSEAPPAHREAAALYLAPPQIDAPQISSDAAMAAAAHHGWVAHQRWLAHMRWVRHMRAVRAAERAAAALAARQAEREQAAQDATAPPQEQPSPAPGVTPTSAFEACVIQAESGGDPRAYNSSSGASGLYGFLLSTWMNLGLGYPGGAYTAPPSVQRQGFLKLYAAEGTAPWAPYDGC